MLQELSLEPVAIFVTRFSGRCTHIEEVLRALRREDIGGHQANDVECTFGTMLKMYA